MIERSICCLILCCCFFSNAYSQSFYFEEHETVLVKTTDHSPVHWYLRIYPLTTVEKTLQWKVIQRTVPSQWEINFEDQSNPNTMLEMNDSSTFQLLQGLEFPQKLIIGAMLNNTVGYGVVKLEISELEPPYFKDTITYTFSISQGTLNVNDVAFEDAYVLKDGFVTLFEGEKASFYAYSLSGELLKQEEGTNRFLVTDIITEALIVIRVQAEDKHYVLKLTR